MNMVEKMARAMAGHFGPDYGALPKDKIERNIMLRQGLIYDNTQEDLLQAAASVLTALSEPTEEMILAALETNSRFGKSAMANIWQAMLAAASKEN